MLTSSNTKIENTKAMPPQFNTNQNFNLLFFWEEVEKSLKKIINYLQENKISQEIRDILKEIKRPNQEKLDNIVNILDKAISDNPTEQLNIFFLEFYRVASIYFYCMENKIKAFDIVEKFIKRINFSFRGKLERDIDVNLLVERDKFMLNKSQMFFWDERLMESLELIDGRLSYFRLDSTDEYYCYKLFPIIISSLCYKGWTHAIQNKDIEARSSFILSIDYSNSYEEWLSNYFKKADLSEAYKRRIKAYHQYLNYLIFKIDNTLSLTEKLDDSKEVSSILLEILNLITNENFSFDSEILKSHLILYHMQAALFSLNMITIKEDMTKDQNIKQTTPTQESVQFAEQCVLYLTHALVHNNSQDLQFKIKFRNTMLFLLFKMMKFLKTDINIYRSTILKKKETENVLHVVEEKLIELIGFYDDSGKIIPPGKYLTNTIRDYTYISSIIKNYALYNINRFNKLAKKEKITETINEIFTIEYICNKLLLIVASLMKDSIEIFPNFDDNCFVIESLNGYLIAKEDSLTLVVMKSFVVEYFEKSEAEDEALFIDTNHNKILYEVVLEKTEQFFSLYTKHVFELKKLTYLDIFTNLALFNSFYTMGLYKQCITVIVSILNELRNLKGDFYETEDHLGYLDLYRFIGLIAVKLYMKLGDFYPAVLLMFDLAEYKEKNEENKEIWGFSDFILYILNGVCLSKLNYSDLGVVYLQFAKTYVTECFESIMESKKADKNKEAENNQKEKIRTNYDNIFFTTPIKLFIGAIDTLLTKAEEKSIVELYANSFYCYSCKNKIDFTPPVEEDNSEQSSNAKKTIFCEKCKRIFYCSFDCMKKVKDDHVPICAKFCVYHSYVNEIVDKINKMRKGEKLEE